MMAPPPHEDELAAIKAAMSLLSTPQRARQVRRLPLPAGVDTLIKIAVDHEAAEALSSRLQRTPGQLMQAGSFFIEQVLLAPGGDSYRTLGACRDSHADFLRRNFIYLCKWVHSEEREGFAGPAYLVRITQAWNNLKTPDRRLAYDRSLDAHLAVEANVKGEDHRRAKGRENSRTQSFRKVSLEHMRRKILTRERKRPSLFARLIAFASSLTR